MPGGTRITDTLSIRVDGSNREIPSEDSSVLTDEEIHSVLSNSRRRGVLEQLRENGGTMPARELAEKIAEAETDESPPPRNKRQSAYVSLHQTHLPKLDDLGIVDYDRQSKEVEIQDQVDQVAVYMETVPKYGIAWSKFYVGLSIVGGLLVAGSQIGVPVLTMFSGWAWGILVLLLIGAAGLHQTYSQGSSIIHRLRK